MLRRRKSELDSKQEEELNKTLRSYEKDHILNPFAGLNPEYMEMSEFGVVVIISMLLRFYANVCLFATCSHPVWDGDSLCGLLSSGATIRSAEQHH